MSSKFDAELDKLYDILKQFKSNLLIVYIRKISTVIYKTKKDLVYFYRCGFLDADEVVKQIRKALRYFTQPMWMKFEAIIFSVDDNKRRYITIIDDVLDDDDNTKLIIATKELVEVWGDE